MADIFTAKYGTSGTVRDDWSKDISFECAEYAAIQNPNDGPITVGSIMMHPGGSYCIPVVSLNSCAMVSGDIKLEYGELYPTEIDGQEASQILRISCGGPMTVKLSLTPSGDLSLKSGKINSHITFSEKESGELHEMKAGTNEVTLTSTLTALGTVTTGSFSGAKTIIMNVQ